MINLLGRLSRVIFLSFWMFILYLIASNIQAGWLYVVIALFFILLIISVFYPTRMLKGITVEMGLPVYTERDAVSNGTIIIRNVTKRMRYMIRVETVGNNFVMEPGAALFVKVEPGAEAVMPVKYRCMRRGMQGPGSVSLTCGVPAGIYFARRLIDCGAYTIVYPSLKVLNDREQAKEFNLHNAGPMQKMIASQDPYHYNLREYTPGDSLRDMHWKLTARIGEPIVRVHERKIFGHAMIVVDNLRSSYPDGKEEIFERALERAIAAARHLLFNAAYTVTVAGTAARAVTLENDSAWEFALHWFAMIKLETAPPEGMMPSEMPSARDVELFFGAEENACAGAGSDARH